jgi:hypothetical protein
MQQVKSKQKETRERGVYEIRWAKPEVNSGLASKLKLVPSPIHTKGTARSVQLKGDQACDDYSPE